MASPAQPFLRAVDISKRYGGVEALQHVSLDIFPGEVIGVVGDTNSGKSTLLGLIAGVLQPDDGQFVIEGRPVTLAPSFRAARLGIRAVHQDINAAEHMSALGYIFAGHPPVRRGPLRWLGWWDQRRMRDEAAAEFRRLGFDLPPLDCALHHLTSAQRRMVAYAHATISTPRLLLLDEPMDSLETHRAQIMRVIEEMRARGGSVLLVTQNLDDVFRVSDRIIVLNAGAKIAERRAGATTEEEIVRLILGSVEDSMTPAVWALSNYFEVRRQAEELDRLYKAFERRAAQLQAHAEVARSATSILDPDKLLPQIVQIIQQRFGYYSTGIFLVAPEGDAVVMRSSASRAAGHTAPENVRLRIGHEGMIGWCAATGKPHLANDVNRDPLFMRENTLPDTRSELVLPLRIGKRVLGVLDLQSDQFDAFGEEDVLALQGLADQLAIAIRNAELFEAAELARQQADEANRYKSVFLSNMSHELRTPLSVIIGHTQAMLSPKGAFYRSSLPEEYAHDLETIRKSGAHLLALINDILDLSKIEAGQLRLKQTVIDLKAILDDTIHTAGGLLHGRPVALVRDYPPDLPPAWGDSVRTRQIVLNLISNAIKFTEEGSITVRAEVQDGMILVSVADTGIGIPEHLRESIFDRFRQGDVAASRKYGGTGLGLSISRQLVALQGGRIWAESEIGAGSVLSFTVPRATPGQIAAHQGEPESGMAEASRMIVFQPPELNPALADKQIVLLAQAETPAAAAIQGMLEGSGFVVEQTAVENGLLDMAEIMLPDLIILDATEPRGPDLLARLGAIPDVAAIPLLALTNGDTGAQPARPGTVRLLPKEEATPRAVLIAARACLPPNTDSAL